MPYKDEQKKKAYGRAYYLGHREQCNAHTRASYQRHREERRTNYNKKRLETRIEVLTYYGGGKLTCVRCGFGDFRALTLDHIAGGGKEEERRRGGTNIAPWLKRRGYPEGI